MGAPSGRWIVFGSLWVIWVRIIHSGFNQDRLTGPSDGLFHSVSRRLTEARLGDAGFILVRLGSHLPTYWSSGSFGLARVHSCATTGRRVIRVHDGSLLRA